jgi:hypothetical protein
MPFAEQSPHRWLGCRWARLALLASCLVIMLADLAGVESAGAGGAQGVRPARAQAGAVAAAPRAVATYPGRSKVSPATPTPRVTTTTAARRQIRTVGVVRTASPTRPHPVLTVAPRPEVPVTTTTLRPPPPAPAPRAPADPAASTPPSPAFQQACWAYQNVQACDAAALIGIDEARAGEGLGPLELPSGFYGLPVASQLVVVANAERTSRGLPVLPEKVALDQSARQGAASGRDPTGPSDYTWDSNYAIGDPTALAADFSWMYDDGPGSNNVDCTTTNHRGCWGHRHNVLSPWSGSAGGGAATYQSSPALAQLFVEA